MSFQAAIGKSILQGLFSILLGINCYIMFKAVVDITTVTNIGMLE